MIRYNALPGVVFVVVMLLQGCASSGNTVSDAALSGDPAAMSRDGAKLNSQGAKLVKRGESRLVSGRKQVREGETMVNNGRNQVSDARFEYKDVAGIGGDATTPDAVSSEAKRLRKIGSRWEDAIEEIREGNALVERGNKLIERAQSDIRMGRQMMERGSTLVRNAERARLNDALLPPTN